MKKEKISLLLLLILGLSLFIVGCQKEEEVEDKTKVYIIATDTDYPPFEFRNESGTLVGIDIDIIKAIAENQEFQISIEVLGFNSAVQAVDTGLADGIIAGMPITDERETRFDFSDPYLESGVVLGVAADSSIQDFEDLRGQSVAVKTGTSGLDFAQSIATTYGFEVTVFDKTSGMYASVLNGETVGCFDDYPTLGYAISNGTTLKIVSAIEDPTPYAFAVKKGENDGLLKMFNLGLQGIKDSGKYQEILNAYIQE